MPHRRFSISASASTLQKVQSILADLDNTTGLIHIRPQTMKSPLGILEYRHDLTHIVVRSRIGLDCVRWLGTQRPRCMKFCMSFLFAVCAHCFTACRIVRHDGKELRKLHRQEISCIVQESQDCNASQCHRGLPISCHNNKEHINNDVNQFKSRCTLSSLQLTTRLVDSRIKQVKQSPMPLQ